MKRTHLGSGFTIVELLIVIVVIAVLATIVVVSYNGVTNKARETAAKSDAIATAKELSTLKTQGGFTIDSLEDYVDVKTNNATISFTSGNSDGFCLDVTAENGTLYYIDTSQSASNVQTGSCPDVNNEGDSRCIASNVYISMKMLNDSASAATITNTASSFGGSTQVTNAGSYYSIAINTRVSSVEAGIMKLQITYSDGSKKTSWHSFQAKSC